MKSKKLRLQIERLDKALDALARAASDNRLETARAGSAGRLFLFCGDCGGVFRADGDGVRCTHCKRVIRFEWPSDTDRSLVALAMYVWPETNEEQMAAVGELFSAIPDIEKQALLKALQKHFIKLGRAA